MKYKCLFFFFSVCPLLTQGQFAFKQKVDIPVIINGTNLANPWAGGLNSGQYSTIDLNLDGADDLVVFDRTSNRLSTFLNIEQAYQYAPEYEALFPPDLNGWLLLVDYNCDGKKDIFSNSTFGMKVYRNQSSEQLSFEFVVDPVVTEGVNTQINLQVSNADIPAITDVDGDGDIDVLVFSFVVGGIMEFHQNLSMETDGTCDNLIFKRLNQPWGDFTECNCGVISFTGNCNDIGGRSANPTHSGGKSLLAFDADGDDDVELVFGDELCSKITYMENQGTPETPLFSSFSAQYPDQSQPADFINFPAAFYEDVDFDGKKDMVIAPNLLANTVDKQVDFQQSSWLYKNIGATLKEQRFEFIKKGFLQDQMIELGENAVPALADYDGDGDQDLILGNTGKKVNQEFIATLWLLENKGTISQPSFELVDNDYLVLSQSKFRDIKPYFADLNNDGVRDLLLAATSTEDLTHRLYFLPNQSNGLGQQFDVSSLKEIALAIVENDNPYFYDVDSDGFVDLLVGKATGGLEFRRNTGNTTNPTFILESDAFAGIANNTGRRNTVPLMEDINNNGQAELLVTDDSGVLRIYTNYLNQAEPKIITEIIENHLVDQPIKTRLGRRSWMAAGSLIGRLPTLIIGGIQGGLLVFDNLSDDGNFNGNKEEFIVDVFPNPGPPFKIIANQSYSYYLYNAVGQIIAIRSSIPANQITNLDSSNLTSGVYLLNAVSVSGASVTQKIIVAP